MDAVTNAITKGAIKKYNKPLDRSIQLNELKIELSKTLRKDKNIQLNELGIKLSKLAKKEG